MKRQSLSDAGLFPGRDCLGHTCGTNIDTEDVDFTNQQPNLTYIDKVFSFNKDTASPILFSLNTGGANRGNFITELFLEGSSLFPCTLSPNAVFEIDNSFVAVEFFGTRPPGNISASQVTLDGFSVDSLSFANGLYTARIENVLSRIQKGRCLDRGLPTKAFFLINNAGPWDIRATYVLEGTVNTNGRICRFRAEISNAPDSPNTTLPSGGLSTFAVRDLSVPCSINGIAPRILFQFSARVNLVNPRLIVNCGTSLFADGLGAAEALGGSESIIGDNLGIPCPSFPCNTPVISPIFTNPCTVSLVSNIAVEPVVHVQTVRRTLFCINACEGLQPCDGSVRAAELEEDIEDCAVGGVDRPDCRCSKRRDTSDSSCIRGSTTEEAPRRGNSVRGAVDNSRNQLEGIYGVGNQELNDGVTVGAGTCGDCVWGRTEGHDCRPCRRRRGETAGAEVNGQRRRSDADEVAGTGERSKHLRNEILGETDRRFIKGLLREIREELAEDTSDVAGIGFAPDGTLGIDDNEVEGVSERLQNTARNASRRNGCNGCSW